MFGYTWGMSFVVTVGELPETSPDTVNYKYYA